MEVVNAIKLRHIAQQKKLIANSSHSVRTEFDTAVAANMLAESLELLKPQEPLQKGSGGEILPPYAFGMSGLELALKEPDLAQVAEVALGSVSLTHD